MTATHIEPLIRLERPTRRTTAQNPSTARRDAAVRRATAARRAAAARTTAARNAAAARTIQRPRVPTLPAPFVPRLRQLPLHTSIILVATALVGLVLQLAATAALLAERGPVVELAIGSAIFLVAVCLIHYAESGNRAEAAR